MRTRFAPSPSGHLHVGGARTALFNWAFAKHHGGVFTLRIEDTDQRRSSEAAGLAFLADLAWLGIDWDEGPEFEGRGGGDAGPYFQSQRLDLYAREIDRLIAGGHAYRAFETPDELDAKRQAARAANVPYRYDRAALAVSDRDTADWVSEGRPHVVRLRVPDDREIVVQDQVLGEVRIPPGELDDFVIRKADGFPTYHFAVVVDDEAMGVTHVLRAQEHLYNTPRHVLLQEALGYRRPVYGHLPLIFNADGSKMSKRDRDRALRAAVRDRGITEARSLPAGLFRTWLSENERQLDLGSAVALAEELGVELPEINVDDFRRAGYLPGVLVNYLSLLGWSPGGDIEKFSMSFLVERFSLDRIGRSNARFDREKLKAFNLDAIQGMGQDSFEAALRGHAAAFHPAFLSRLDDAGFRLFATANHERCRTLEEPFRLCDFLVIPDDAIVYGADRTVRKALGADPETLVRAAHDAMESVASWDAESIAAALASCAAQHAEGKLGKVAQPIRVAVTGTTVSPPIDVTLVMLGRASTLARLRRFLEHLPTIMQQATA